MRLAGDKNVPVPVDKNQVLFQSPVQNCKAQIPKVDYLACSSERLLNLTRVSNTQCVCSPTTKILSTLVDTFHGLNCFSHIIYMLQYIAKLLIHFSNTTKFWSSNFSQNKVLIEKSICDLDSPGKCLRKYLTDLSPS